MKKFPGINLVYLLSCFILTGFTSFDRAKINPEDIIGSWESGPAENRTVRINTDNVFSVATYNLPGKEFIKSYGGTWRIEDDKLIEKIEWNSAEPAQVGREFSYTADIRDGKLHFHQNNQTWNRVDDGKSGELAGAWIISGSFSGDKVSKRQNPFYPRRTMKVLSGSRFHWIAYNVESKQFINAGGGTYTSNNGKYTETIEFFTKTPASVGKTLGFRYSFVNGDWRHQGEKSTGGPMDECWSRRETFEKQ